MDPVLTPRFPSAIIAVKAGHHLAFSRFGKFSNSVLPENIRNVITVLRRHLFDFQCYIVIQYYTLSRLLKMFSIFGVTGPPHLGRVV